MKSKPPLHAAFVCICMHLHLQLGTSLSITRWPITFSKLPGKRWRGKSILCIWCRFTPAANEATQEEHQLTWHLTKLMHRLLQCTALFDSDSNKTHVVGCKVSKHMSMCGVSFLKWLREISKSQTVPLSVVFWSKTLQISANALRCSKFFAFLPAKSQVQIRSNQIWLRVSRNDRTLLKYWDERPNPGTRVKYESP